MPNNYQKTIGGKVSLDGVGLHTGVKCTLNINSAKENSGIFFKRTDLEGKPTVPADVDYVISTNRGTMLERNGVRIHTVEHVLAALRGLGIDNAIIELSAPEPPIMDGSALPFVQAINKVGTSKQSAAQDVYKVTEPVQLNDFESNIEINILPAEQFKITFFMDYGLPSFGLQYVSIEDVESEFIKEIAPARTFGLLSEVAQLKQEGLIKGGNLNNAVIVVDKKVDKNETHLEKQKRWRESKIWEEASQRSFIKNSKTKIIEVMDREGDVFDIMQNCLSLNHDFLIRAKNDRILNDLSKNKLFEFIKTIKPQGFVKLDIRKRHKQIHRKALLDVSFSNVKILGPKNRKNEDIACNVVYVIEKNPPKTQEPLEWILLTSVTVNSFEDACQIIKWYKCRWIIEEYHKAIKSGCKVEEKQLKTGERLENFLGIANIVALRIMKLRDYARNTPLISAKEVIEPLKVEILIRYNDIKKEDITIYEYYREVAKIGGFLGRKSDGEPGWQTLWAGETELSMLVIGAKIALGKKTYG